MFRSTSRTLRAWWIEFSDDILGADLQPTADGAGARPAPIPAPISDLAYHRDHPHRRPLATRRLQRPGQVPERPAFCLSPVRAAEPASRTDRISR